MKDNKEKKIRKYIEGFYLDEATWRYTDGVNYIDFLLMQYAIETNTVKELIGEVYERN